MKTIEITIEDDDGAETVHALPAHWAICERCDGEGRHDPEAFSQGFTGADFAEDPDFRADYFAGRYDVPCECCRGAGKVLEVDADRLNEAERAIYVRHVEAEADRLESERAEAFTRRMENGGAY